MKFTPTYPSIVLDNPKFAHNVGAIIRIASCFDIKNVVYTGNRIQTELEQKKRLPREERMKGYKDVELIAYDYPIDLFPNSVPVAIEVRENSENLFDFVHPENAVYIFGAEDGNISRGLLTKAHRFVIIPTKHCLNLATAVSIVMYDRAMKLGEYHAIDEQRGFIDTDIYDIRGTEKEL